jgi:peptide/nickel transport system substrate-binding protein
MEPLGTSDVPFDNAAPTAAPTEQEASRSLHEHRALPFLKELQYLLVHFSPAERLLLYILSAGLGVAAFALLALLNIHTSILIPTHGGSLIEGVVGTPRFVNPVIAEANADKDITALVYSGLMRALPDGTMAPDLAESYTLSENELDYTFTLRADAVFHDGTVVTADDVVFTIKTVQNPEYKSPHRTEWEGVSIEALDERTVHIVLPRPYAPFLEIATLGILPRTLWQNVSPEDFPFHRLNTSPIGSGPYEITDSKEDSRGSPEEYTLSSFKKFALGEPYIAEIIVRFFASEEDAVKALERGTIESLAAISPESITTDMNAHVRRSPLPRIFAVFFNQTKNAVFTDSKLREALSVVAPRTEIINQTMRGFGVPINGPLPPNFINSETPYAPLPLEERRAEAARILDAAGWRIGDDGVRRKDKQELSFSIATADTPELSTAADLLAAEWRLVGARVTVKVFSPGDLNVAAIRPREYDALLFGEVIGKSGDVYAFWHSSQRNDPGLNLALYTNAKVDKLLTDIRKEQDPEARQKLLTLFNETVQDEHPATFLFSPEFVYSMPTTVEGVDIGPLTTPSERFSSVHTWHREVERVWSIFTR